MNIFKGQNLLEFTERFKTDLDCKEYLGNIKWRNGYTCRKCGNKSYQVRKGFSRTCDSYSDTESDKGLNFKALHTVIHQIKSWIRTTYSWVSEFNLNRYFNEFCFRINRSQSKNNIFNSLITKMVNSHKIYQNEIICSELLISKRILLILP